MTMVNAVPWFSGGAVCATNVENCGESVITVIPFSSNAASSTWIGAKRNKIGDKTERVVEIARLPKATLALPYLRDRWPPTTHPTDPIPMTQKATRLDDRGPLWENCDWSRYACQKTGTQVQNA